MQYTAKNNGITSNGYDSLDALIEDTAHGLSIFSNCDFYADDILITDHGFLADYVEERICSENVHHMTTVVGQKHYPPGRLIVLTSEIYEQPRTCKIILSVVPNDRIPLDVRQYFASSEHEYVQKAALNAGWMIISEAMSYVKKNGNGDIYVMSNYNVPISFISQHTDCAVCALRDNVDLNTLLWIYDEGICKYRLEFYSLEKFPMEKKQKLARSILAETCGSVSHCFVREMLQNRVIGFKELFSIVSKSNIKYMISYCVDDSDYFFNDISELLLMQSDAVADSWTSPESRCGHLELIFKQGEPK